MCLFRYEGPAYLMHGAVCFALYTYTACTGFLHFYGALLCVVELVHIIHSAVSLVDYT